MGDLYTLKILFNIIWNNIREHFCENNLQNEIKSNLSIKYETVLNLFNSSRLSSDVDFSDKIWRMISISRCCCSSGVFSGWSVANNKLKIILSVSQHSWAVWSFNSSLPSLKNLSRNFTRWLIPSISYRTNDLESEVEPNKSKNGCWESYDNFWLQII